MSTTIKLFLGCFYLFLGGKQILLLQSAVNPYLLIFLSGLSVLHIIVGAKLLVSVFFKFIAPVFLSICLSILNIGFFLIFYFYGTPKYLVVLFDNYALTIIQWIIVSIISLYLYIVASDKILIKEWIASLAMLSPSIILIYVLLLSIHPERDFPKEEFNVNVNKLSSLSNIISKDFPNKKAMLYFFSYDCDYCFDSFDKLLPYYTKSYVDTIVSYGFYEEKNADHDIISEYIAESIGLVNNRKKNIPDFIYTFPTVFIIKNDSIYHRFEGYFPSLLTLKYELL